MKGLVVNHAVEVLDFLRITSPKWRLISCFFLGVVAGSTKEKPFPNMFAMLPWLMTLPFMAQGGAVSSMCKGRSASSTTTAAAKRGTWNLDKGLHPLKMQPQP